MIPRSRHDDANAPRKQKPDASLGIVRRAFGHRGSHDEDRALAERRSELDDYAAKLDGIAAELGRREQALQDERASVERLLRRSTAELEGREKELVQFERELEARGEHVQATEVDLAQRRSDLGAVELKRAALEQRERALEKRESEVDQRESRLGAAEQEAVTAELFFLPGYGYRLIRAHPAQLSVGGLAQVEGERYRVARVGPSPLPGDRRRCAYLSVPAPASSSDED
jgi:hypothetical protein